MFEYMIKEVWFVFFKVEYCISMIFIFILMIIGEYIFFVIIMGMVDVFVDGEKVFYCL